MQSYENNHSGIARPASIIIPNSSSTAFHDSPSSVSNSSPLPTNQNNSDTPLNWSNSQVLSWLSNSGMSQAILDAFKEHNITGIVLPYLNSNELLEMGIIKLSQRLEIKKLITNLLSNSNTINNSSTLLDKSSELQALMISNELIQNVSKQLTQSININNQNNNFRKLNDQFNKLREDLLPIVKQLKDKKPLPLPSITNSPTRLNHHQAQLQSSIQPQKAIKNLSHSSSITSLNSRKSATSIDSPYNYNQHSPNLSDLDYSSRKPSSATSLTNSSISTSTAASTLNNSTSISNINSLMSSSNTLTLPNNNNSTQTVDPNKSPVRSFLDPNNKKLPRSTSFNNLQNRSSSFSGSVPTLNRLNSSSSTTNSSIQTSTVGNNTPTHSNEPLKQLRAKTDDPCYKTLQAAMKRHNLSPSDWKKFALVICYGGDQERVLGYDEKPVLVFRELSELGLNPSIMLRQIEDVDEDSLNNNHHHHHHHHYYEDVQTPGGRL